MAVNANNTPEPDSETSPNDAPRIVGGADLYQRGLLCAHSSDGDGIADVGLSIGLGNGAMLYVGEAPNAKSWALVLYREHSGPTLRLSEGLDEYDAKEAIEFVSAAINYSPGKSKLQKPTIWIMRTADGFYPIEPSDKCTPADHGEINPHVSSIEDIEGNILWSRTSKAVKP